MDRKKLIVFQNKNNSSSIKPKLKTRKKMNATFQIKQCFLHITICKTIVTHAQINSYNVENEMQSTILCFSNFLFVVINFNDF